MMSSTSSSSIIVIKNKKKKLWTLIGLVFFCILIIIKQQDLISQNSYYYHHQISSSSSSESTKSTNSQQQRRSIQWDYHHHHHTQQNTTTTTTTTTARTTRNSNDNEDHEDHDHKHLPSSNNNQHQATSTNDTTTTTSDTARKTVEEARTEATIGNHAESISNNISSDIIINNNKTNTTTNTTTTHNNNKPYLIFHVGIPKSATTTIQCGLTKFSKELALQDQYYYLGKPCALLATYSQMRYMPNNEEPIGLFYVYQDLYNRHIGKPTRNLISRLQYHASHNHNVVLSSENFVNGFTTFNIRTKSRNNNSWDLFKSIFDDYNVRIVVTYRRYFEYLPSQYYQHNLRKVEQSLMDYMTEKLAESPPANTFKHLQNKHPHPTIQSIQIYLQQQFDDVYIYNMYQPGDLVTNFICQALVNATNICSDQKRSIIAVQQQQHDQQQQSNDSLLELSSSNSTTTFTTTTTNEQQDREEKQEILVRTSKSLDYDKLKIVATGVGYKEMTGRATTTSSKRRVSLSRVRFDKYSQTEEYKSIYQTLCLSQTKLDLLLERSLQYEKQLITLMMSSSAKSNNTNNNNEHLQILLDDQMQQQHIDNFNQYLNEGKYCEINTTIALQNTSFMEYIFGRKPKQQQQQRNSNTTTAKTNNTAATVNNTTDVVGKTK